MRVIALLLVAAAPFLGACGSGVSESWPSTGTQVSEAEANSFCSAFAVIQQKCVRCHSNPPVNGAPFPLDSYDATQVQSKSGEPRTERMKQAIESGYMPLVTLRVDPPVEPLGCEERATILAWIADGAPPPTGDAACGDVTPSLAPCEE